MGKWQFSTPGIPDEHFVRLPGVPMTKEEVRAITISKLQLFPRACVYDIGAGSGSVAVECAILCQGGKVFAVEREEKALEAIRKNIAHFELHNIESIPGVAPQAMEELPPAHRIFIGGSGGNLEEILVKAKEKLLPGGRLVVNSVTLDTGPKAVEFMEKNSFRNIDITSVSIAKAAARGQVKLWQSRNPVQIVSGTKEE
ncbi:MAG: cobalt-precorrin-6B (C15)-methyltransferase [Clostridia bacterium]|jgi:cobalt-precorrin-6B (C15)-methyltransferase|nr:precorrin-6Y C5,15-methyltransferase (decarboxylating), CbiT subunit [Clostridiales bacterium]MDK2984855.1 cobalt-precorrin-6B (C15)-methyltransferase [Clostridia bacterium]